jgi:hypothetical protein
VAKYRANELIHARWAMLAAAGILIPEALQANGSDIVGGTYYETPLKMLNGGTLNWSIAPFGVVANPLPLVAVVAVNTALMAAVEGFRGKGEGPAGYSPGVGKFDSGIFAGLDPLYPGGPFDPLGLADDPEVFQELQVKEIKNGRLAMISVLAFAVQSYVTKEGPWANISKHLAVGCVTAAALSRHHATAEQSIQPALNPPARPPAHPPHTTGPLRLQLDHHPARWRGEGAYSVNFDDCRFVTRDGELCKPLCNLHCETSCAINRQAGQAGATS